MKIIIVGLGKTGMLLADTLSRENHDVTVVDCDKEKVEAATDKYSVSGVWGSGASQSVLLKAGADTADVVLALTPSDEANLMTCMTAKRTGTRFAALKLERPEFGSDKNYLSEQFGIDYIVNTKLDTAKEINRQIGLPGRVKADAFFDNEVIMLRIDIGEGSPLAGSSLKDVRGIFDADMLVATVRRGEKVFVPDGSFVIQQGDVADVIAPSASVEKIVQKLGLVRKPVKKVFIVGGGTTGLYLAGRLLKEGKQVTILECDKERCIELSEMLPEARIAYAEAIDSNVLHEEGIDSADVCVSLTGEDEKNLVISLFAWSCGIGSIITKVNQPTYERLLSKVKIDISISPTVISADMLMRFIRNITVYNEKGNDINRIYSIAGGLAEAIEFVAFDDCRLLGVPLKNPEFKLKKGLLLAGVIRGSEVIIPNGSTTIESGDRVIVIAKAGHRMNILNDIFA